MVNLNIPEQTARNLLEYINEFVDNTSNTKHLHEAMEDKMRIKRAIGRAEGIPRSMMGEVIKKRKGVKRCWNNVKIHVNQLD